MPPEPATPVKIEPAVPSAPVAPAPAPSQPPVSEPVKAEPVASVAPAKVEEAAISSPSPPPPTTLLTEAAPAPPPPPPPAKPTPTVEPVAPPAESAITYEPFKLPEGFVVDEKGMNEFTEVLREAKAPQAAGQKLVDLFTKEVQKIAEYQRNEFNKTLETWKNDVMADPLLGGNRFQAVLKRCGDVLNEFGDQDLRNALNVSGLGNHPAVFRFLNKVAAFVGEPKPVPAHTPAPQPKPSRAQRRYGNGAQPTG